MVVADHDPPYPAYAGNAAAIGATSATIMALFFGREDISFEVYWEGTPADSFIRRLLELAEEQARSRIYGGFTLISTATPDKQSGATSATTCF